ncbi:cupin domain-containing protein [Catenovulum maritimum]|uniref:DUF985 domain-containing protein n=1 Tax=Catenovulum maritimum TaxID=1513271 RepID=A0A0J8GT30_9ALTE|nr:cupin domain-containing protein [Catenovulum maritimum]KMT65912.1 hypothetical protein XM47_05445 [Catenovulum maritimum]
MVALDLVQQLNLVPHPEGGYFTETYRSELTIQAMGFDAERACSTGIYFLLEQGDFSAFHRIKSDEMWHFYSGQTLEIIEIDLAGTLSVTLLGQDITNGEQPQYVVKAGHWFASRPKPTSLYSLVGCTVAPGFDFADFEMADSKTLIERFPQHKDYINQLCRD